MPGAWQGRRAPIVRDSALLFQQPSDPFRRVVARYRGSMDRRIVGIGAALLVELLLVLVLLTLAPDTPPRAKGERTTVFNVAPEREEPEREEQRTERAPQPRQEREVARTPDPAPVPPPVPATPAIELPPAVIPLSRADMAAADITPPSPPAAPATPRRGVAGPPNVGGGAPDTPRVAGSGPNGEPLYAASWYREPYPEELRGYLSTATGPGWGLIACRTVPNYRVEDCIALDEYPRGSNIARSVLAAAWQFKVRPPRLGGEVRVGEWVRIRIDYDLRSR